MNKHGFLFGKYKSFENETVVGEIRRLNILVGRNNSGKSSVIDAVEELLRPASRQLKVNFTLIPSSLVVREVLGRMREAQLFWAHQQQLNVVPHNEMGNIRSWERIRDLCSPHPLEKKQFRRIASERDMAPEELVGAGELEPLSPTGKGATSVIAGFLSRKDLPHRLVEKDLLQALNAIFQPDTSFQRIQCQTISAKLWEVYLEDDNNNDIPLSASGSGLKTVLLVLINLFLIPHTEKRSPKDYVFAFEELENNLHPALQRRLFKFVHDFAKQHECVVFLTTHSPIVIDLFAHEEDVHLLLVTQEKRRSQLISVGNPTLRGRVLDELEVRASDILQANGVIWVEGPSDRIYINRWIDLISGGLLKEGRHYQCVFFGGSLNAHLTAGTDLSDMVQLLLVNRKGIIMMDSDRRRTNDPLKVHTQRLKTEFEDAGMKAWITHGREVENYIPSRILKDAFGVAKSTRYQSVPDLAKKAKGHKTFDKVAVAKDVAQRLTRDDIRDVPDLETNLTEVVKLLKVWNGIG